MINQKKLSYGLVLFGTATVFACKELSSAVPTFAYILCIAIAFCPVAMITAESLTIRSKSFERKDFVFISIITVATGIVSTIYMTLTLVQTMTPSRYQFIVLGTESILFGILWLWYLAKKQLTKNCEYVIQRLSIFEPYTQITFEEKDIAVDILMKWIEQRTSFAKRYVKYVIKTDSLTE